MDFKGFSAARERVKIFLRHPYLDLSLNWGKKKKEKGKMKGLRRKILLQCNLITLYKRYQHFCQASRVDIIYIHHKAEDDFNL